MTGRNLLGSAMVVFVLVCAPAGAVQEPRDHGKPHFDSRRGDRAAVPQRTADAREALELRLGDEGGVDADRVGGGLRRLGRTDDLLTGPQRGDAAEIASGYLRAHRRVLGLDDADLDALRLASRYTSPNGVTHLTWQQTSRGLPSYDGALTVNVAADGSIVNLTGTAVHDLDIPSATPALTPSEALAAGLQDVGGAMTAPRARTEAGVERRTRFSSGDTARLVAFADPDGDRLAWRLTVAGEEPFVYDEVVDARTGKILARHSLTEFAANASVFDHHPGAPAGGTPHIVDLSADPHWMSRSTLTTPARLDGRNAHTYADVGGVNGFDPGEDIPPSAGTDWLYPQIAVACASGSPSIFSGICTWSGDTATRAEEPTNRAQTTTQLHYFVNTFHDWLAAAPIGFTDASHNFEIGGRGGSDQVNAEADDSSGFNNANMSTPSDGNSPRMQMYLFTNPVVNSGDDGSVVYHEYVHGLSNRLVNNGLGGGLNSDQPRAMGEGWSDWYAMDYLVEHGYVRDTPADGEVVTGAYVTNNADRGIRRNAIDCSVGSTDASCPGNPFVGTGGWTFDDMGHVGAYGTVGTDRYTRFQVHDDGEIWSQTLWDLRTVIGGAAARGLVTEAMRLSPSNPSFLDERDAILQADQVAGGTHRDRIWAVFAARGMGYSARVAGPDATRARAAFDLPPASLVTAAAPTVTDPAPLGDGDSRAESGETARLRISLRNASAATLTDVKATLTTTTPGVTVGQATVSYPDLGARATDASDIPFAITLPTSLPCTTVVALTLAVHADQGDITVPLSLALGTPAGTAFNATSPLPAAIPDRLASGNLQPGPTVTVNVPGAGTVDRLRVTVSTNHTFIGDLHGRLTAPDGTAIELFERPGGGPFGAGIAGMNAVVFDDAAPTGIQDLPAYAGGPSLPAVSGSYKPNEPLQKFDGHPQQGDWKLRVFDAATGDDGSITAVSIQPAAGTPTCATTAPAPPTVASAPASDVTTSSATLNGSLDPGTADTQYQFQYGTTTAYGQTTPLATATADSGAAARAAAIAGLAASTTYHYRLVARRAGTVVAVSPDASFTTLATPPEAVTDAATNVSATSATLNGTVDAKGFPTGFRFDFGPTDAYGSSTSAGDAGSAAGALARSAALAGLAPSTTYHFRVVALRAGAVAATGRDATFTTSAAPVPSPTVTPTPTPAPAVSVTGLPKKVRIDRRRRLRFAFRATPPGLRGTIALTTAKTGKARAIKLGSAVFTTPAAGEVKLAFRVSRKAMSKLQRRKRVDGTAVIAVGGNVLRVSFKLTVARRKPPRR